MNKRAFNRLDDATKKAVRAAAARAETRGWTMSKAETDEKIAILKKNGIIIVTPSAELVNSLKDIGKILSDDWSKKAGADGVAILKAYHAK